MIALAYVLLSTITRSTNSKGSVDSYMASWQPHSQVRNSQLYGHTLVLNEKKLGQLNKLMLTEL